MPFGRKLNLFGHFHNDPGHAYYKPTRYPRRCHSDSSKTPTMKKPVKRLLFWAPRILCIAFALFLNLFALDVFGESQGFWKTALALLMHLIPTGLILLVLAVSWRWEWVGAILFPALGGLYLFMFWGRFPWSVYLLISGPLFLAGVLFLLGWLRRSELRIC
jgi:MFS family permease